MDRSLFLARLMGPTFVAIALGIVINLGMYESMIAEALQTASCSICPGCCRCSAGLGSSSPHPYVATDRRVTLTVLAG